jgi:hypothetical protein
LIKKRFHVLTEEKQYVGARLNHWPRKLVDKIYQQVQFSVSSARTATKY